MGEKLIGEYLDDGKRKVFQLAIVNAPGEATIEESCENYLELTRFIRALECEKERIKNEIFRLDRPVGTKWHVNGGTVSVAAGKSYFVVNSLGGIFELIDQDVFKKVCKLYPGQIDLHAGRGTADELEEKAAVKRVIGANCLVCRIKK